MIDASQKALALFGYGETGAIIDQDTAAAPDRSTIQLNRLSRRFSWDGHVRFEIDFINKNGDVIPTEVTSSILNISGKKVIQGIVRDIRERKLAEQARQETFAIIERSPVVAFLVAQRDGMAGRIRHPECRSYFRVLEYRFFIGPHPFQQGGSPGRLGTGCPEVTTYSREPGQTAFVHEPYRIQQWTVRLLGAKHQILILRHDTGEITHFQGIVEQITTRVVAEQALRESEAKVFTPYSR